MYKILWKTSIVLMAFSSLRMSKAGAETLECSTNSSMELPELEKTIEVCQKKALLGQFVYLPRFISYGDRICNTIRSSTFEELKNCKLDLIETTIEIFNCNSSKNREKEMQNSDELEFKNKIKEFGIIAVPESIQNIFKRLTIAAARIDPTLGNRPWNLRAYGASYFNAHAGAGLNILISAGFWKEGSPFSLEETASILAHEVGHEIKRHSLRQGCLALEWVGDKNQTLPQAVEIVRGEGHDGGERWNNWVQSSHEHELEADAIATRVLNEAGLNPYLMSEALTKLRPKSEGIGSNSHPDFELRIEKARAAADQLR
jgi:hypothetical protein